MRFRGPDRVDRSKLLTSATTVMVTRVMFVVVMDMRVMSVVLVVHVCVEPVVLVGRVRYLADTTVRLDQAIAAVHYVPVPFLPLVFVVLCVRVFDAVFERVLGWSLQKSRDRNINVYNIWKWFVKVVQRTKLWESDGEVCHPLKYRKWITTLPSPLRKKILNIPLQ